ATQRISIILRLRRLVEFAILYVIKQAYKNLKQCQKPSQEEVADRLISLAKARGVAIVSTNYDELLEYQIYTALLRGHGKQLNADTFQICNREINFGYSWRDGSKSKTIWHPPGRSILSILKLHGSTLWFKCNGCGWVVCDDSMVSEEQSCIDMLCKGE